MSEPGFRHGVIVGFGGFLVLVQLGLASELVNARDMYRDIGHVEVSALTRLTLHAAWLWGMPLVGAAALIALLVRRPRSLAIYIAVATALAVVTAMTWYFPRAPIFALAGNIQP